MTLSFWRADRQGWLSGFSRKRAKQGEQASSAVVCRKSRRFLKKAAKSFVVLEPGVLNAPGPDSKKSLWFAGGHPVS
jgi:hypothetical protein